MKEFCGLAANLMLAEGDGEKFRGVAETGQFRFGGTADAMRQMAAMLGKYADALDALEKRANRPDQDGDAT